MLFLLLAVKQHPLVPSLLTTVLTSFGLVYGVFSAWLGIASPKAFSASEPTRNTLCWIFFPPLPRASRSPSRGPISCSCSSAFVLAKVIGALRRHRTIRPAWRTAPVTLGVPSVTAIVICAGDHVLADIWGNAHHPFSSTCPAKAASVMTDGSDGHQLARQGGRGRRSACRPSDVSRRLGAVTALDLRYQILARSSLCVSPLRIFLIEVLGITATASMGTGSPIKALMMAVFGLMLALVGTDPILGSSRLTFGETELSKASTSFPSPSASSASARS